VVGTFVLTLQCCTKSFAKPAQEDEYDLWGGSDPPKELVGSKPEPTLLSETICRVAVREVVLIHGFNVPSHDLQQVFT
jgi:hypothetical protein